MAAGERDWRRINEGLVKRGEILLDLRILDRWDSELAEMNSGKEGRRFVYPEVFVKLLGYVHLLFHLPYRQTEGFLKPCQIRRDCAVPVGSIKPVLDMFMGLPGTFR